MKYCKTIFIFTFFMLPMSLLSQDRYGNSYKVQIFGTKISTADKKGYLYEMGDSSIIISTRKGILDTIHYSSIKSIQLTKSGGAVMGFVIGSLTSIGIGTVAAYSVREGEGMAALGYFLGGIMLSIPLGTAGALIGTSKNHYGRILYDRTNFIAFKNKIKGDSIGSQLQRKKQLKNIVEVIEEEHKFSSSGINDEFSLTVRGNNIFDAIVEFKIVNSFGDVIYRDRFKTIEFLEKSPRDTTKSSIESDSLYILDKLHTFFDDRNFYKPAVTDSTQKASDFTTRRNQRTIKKQPRAIGFQYQVNQAKTMKIAYSGKSDLVLIIFKE